MASPERNEGQKDSRKFRLTQKDAAEVAGFLGGFYGGASYGITRFIADKDLANSVGIGVGVGLGAAAGGMLGAFAADHDADTLAVQGNIRKATIKGIQGAIEAEAGFVTSGAISGYEINGIKGAIIGGIIGGVLGTGFPLITIPGKRETGKAYRDVIHPTLNPQNFPQFNIIKDVLFDEKDLLVDSPPVYIAGSINDMLGFRQAQVDSVIAKAPTMKREYKNPDVLLGRIPAAIFIIPNVIHYPAFDPEFETVLFGRLKEPSTAMTLSDPDGVKVVAKPHTSETTNIWPHASEFEDEIIGRKFNEKRWQHWREKAWNQEVVILATRKVEPPAIGTTVTSDSLKVNETYQLIDILVGGSGKAGRIKKKEPIKERLKGLIPVRDPQGI